MKSLRTDCCGFNFGRRNIHITYSFIIMLVAIKISGLNITIGFLVPYTGARSFGREIDADIKIAIDKCNNEATLTALRSSGITFNYLIADTHCDTGTGLFEMVEMIRIQSLTENSIDAIIGPACDEVCSAAGLLTGKWNIPMISYACASGHLVEKVSHPTSVLTSLLYNNVVYLVIDIMNKFKWNRLIIAEGPELIWRETAIYLDSMLELQGFTHEIKSLHAEEQWLGAHIQEQWKTSRVVLICAYGRDIFRVLCEAKHHIFGDYVYLTLDFGMSVNFPEYDSYCNDSILNVFEGVLDITADVFGVENQEFTLNKTAHSSFMKPVHTYMLDDAVRLYATTLNQSLTNGVNVSGGSVLASYMYNMSFQGSNGMVQMNGYGSRRSNISVYNIQNGKYIKVASSNGSLGATYFLKNTLIVWPNGKTDVPLGYPLCGWLGEFCPDITTDISLPIGLATGLIILLSLVSTALYCYRKKKLHDQMENMNWVISSSELILDADVHRARSRASQFSSTRSSTYDLGDGRRTASHESEISAMQQVFIKTAKYQNVLVAIKFIHKSYVAITTDVIYEINQIRKLKHVNINQLLGACIEPLNVALVSTYCNKGSLQDVLENETVRLDWMFKMSFASDIAKGMEYLHASDVQTHGRLKSLNIYIDSFWTCKIGDIAMPYFREGERSTDSKHILYSQLMWTAPEILREPEAYPRGTQKGDVYSFAIILQEILLRTLPFGDECQEPQEIIKRVQKREHPPYRPKVPVDSADEAVLDLLRICWEEIPPFRPNFPTICDTLWKCNKGGKTNLIEQMIHLMQKYSDNLEDLVHDRTKQLEEEQRKTEDLLCRMLPRSVANDLKAGKEIHPLTYDNVTIYFSDIVGFTALCSDSTPMEVVNFLNDLYTCFDAVLEYFDVYKVETIGDAYMVVSGLPVRNGNQHASEIATMALHLLSCVITFKIRHRPNKQLQLRVGIHSGPVAAGVVGVKMPRYCLFGDTVNYASRMESTGVALRIHVSPSCIEILKETGEFEYVLRGVVYLKGKGAIETYFLTGKQGFTKKLPDITTAGPEECELIETQENNSSKSIS